MTVVLNALTQSFECRVCGATRSLDLPAPVRAVVLAGQSFASEHRSCRPKQHLGYELEGGARG